MWITAFKTGTHTDMSGETRVVTRDHLDTIVSKFDPAKRKAPACVGHPDLNSPAYGWFDQVKREGDFLRMHLGEKTAEFAEAVKKGLYKYVSIALKPDMSIRHVGFLGGHPPAIEGLGEVKFAAEGEKLQAYQFADYNMSRIARIMQGLREYILLKDGQEEADRRISQWDIDEIDRQPAEMSYAAPITPTEESPMNKTVEQLEAELAAEKAENARLKGEATTATTQLTTLQFAQAREADKTFVTGLGTRVLPAHVPKVLDFMSILREKGEFAFAEGGKKAALDEFKGFLGSLPEQLAFAEQATVTRAAGTDADEAGPASKKIRALVDQKIAQNSALTFSDATRLVFAENPALTQTYNLELQAAG